MKHQLSYTIALIALGMAGIAVSPAKAATVAAGPYYANPSWDQKLPASTRFVVLSNWNNEAVLDRETGLVWEKSPSSIGFSSDPNPLAQLPWNYVTSGCLARKTGGRLGWRAPTVDELLTLIDPIVPAPGPTLPTGHPFTNAQPSAYWTATLQAGGSTSAFIVRFDIGGPDLRSTGVGTALGWCVRGASHAQVY